NGLLYLSSPLVYRASADDPRTTPVGFVLGPERLVTVRFEELVPFTTFGEAAPGTAAEAFAGLIEAIVDRLADVLERIAAELDTLSHRLFRSERVDGKRRRPARAAADPRVLLPRIGGSGEPAPKLTG